MGVETASSNLQVRSNATTFTDGIKALDMDLSGNVTFISSVTASGLFGSGSGITNVKARSFQIKVKTDFDGLTPSIGDTYYCSDCTVPYDICTATGTGLSDFRAVTLSAISTVVPGTLVPRGCGTGQ